MNHNISYKINIPLKTKDIIDVFDSSGIIRPTQDPKRIKKMFANSNLTISAWDKKKLVGISRSVTDFSFCCYLSDLAVSKEYQKMGIGKELIKITRENIGESVMLLLLSAAPAMDYYPKVGFEKVENGFIIKRK
ncbi:MAG TPA: GNAT family N-acetyltransferase [candidate division Zixibacteria bacterium]|nr:GNAT family N-acetyltransferase [candidate division Zixibacteria bacterium]